MLLSLGAILLYVGIRYEFKFALGAVIALFHDVFAALGVICFLNREVSLTVIAALLTIAGYSINDTIVVFDRIRERSKQLHKLSHEDMMNTAMNETLSRTIITSLTVFLATLALLPVRRRGHQRLRAVHARRRRVRHVLVDLRGLGPGARHLAVARPQEGRRAGEGGLTVTSKGVGMKVRHTAGRALVLLLPLLLFGCGDNGGKPDGLRSPSARATRRS